VLPGEAAGGVSLVGAAAAGVSVVAASVGLELLLVVSSFVEAAGLLTHW
jgi:hypothetical protein